MLCQAARSNSGAPDHPRAERLPGLLPYHHRPPHRLHGTSHFGGMVTRSRAAHHGGMTTTNSKQIVREFISALFSKGDLMAVDRYLDPDFINHDPPLPGAPDGPEGMREAAEVFRQAFPDWRSDPQHMIAEGDLVAEHFVAHGTHRASVM